jgi:hypothetical protein
MNAVVLAVRDGKSAVLLKDGTIRNIPKEYKVGETVHVASRQTGIISMVSAAAAALVIFVSGIAGYNYMSRTACSYVTLDVNPSIEYTLNRRDEVIKIAPLNSDAEPIVASVNEQTGKKSALDEAINQTLDALTENNYLKAEEENYLLFDVVSDNAKRSDKIISTINEIADTNSTDDYHVVSSSLEDHKEAANNNMSAGRYKMMKDELESTGEEVSASSVSAYKSKSVRDMISPVEEASSKDKTSDDKTSNKTANDAKTEMAKQKQTTVTQPSVSDDNSGNSGSSVSAGSSQTVTASEDNKNNQTGTTSVSGKKKLAAETGSTESSTGTISSGSSSSDSGSSESTADAGSGDNSGSSSGSGKKKPVTPPADEPDPGSGSDPVPVGPDPGTDNPGTDDPGTDEPGTDNPGTDNPGTDDPGTDEPGTDNPGTDNPGTDNPGGGDSGTDDPDAGDSGTSDNDSGEAENGAAEDYYGDNSSLYTDISLVSTTSME